MLLILAIAIILITVALLFTLTETLVWLYLCQQQAKASDPPNNLWKVAIVFLTGISDYQDNQLQLEQIAFLQQLNLDIITENFPYETITARKFINIWHYLGGQNIPFWVMSLHNFWQTLLSSWFTEKYGQLVTECLINRLGYPQENSQLIFICGSAGASIALSAIPSLKQLELTQISIISYGGVFASAKGLDTVSHFYHLVGKNDYWVMIAKLMFPQRLLNIRSIRKAKRENRWTLHYTGEHGHMEYLSDRACAISQETYRNLTVKTIINLPIWENLDIKRK